MVNYISLHDGNNLSDHAAVLLTLDINSDYFTNIDFEKRAQLDRHTESDITINEASFYNYLSNTKMPLGALHCIVLCENHTTDLNEYLDLIMDAYKIACGECIPNARKKSAGWNEIDELGRNEAIFWHGIWMNDHTRVS